MAGERGSRTVEVTPAEVTFDDQPGTEADTFTVPRSVGVEYLVAGEVVEAGTYPGEGTVTVTARTLEGFELAAGATAEWSHTFSADGGAPTDPVEALSRLSESLGGYVASGAVAGPIAHQLATNLEQAERHLQGGRVTQTVGPWTGSPGTWTTPSGPTPFMLRRAMTCAVRWRWSSTSSAEPVIR